MKRRITKEEQISFIHQILNEKLNKQAVIPSEGNEDTLERLQIDIETLGEIYCTISQNNLNEYQINALRTANKLTPDELVLNGVLGLNGESGEVADLYKKFRFQGHDLDEDKLIDELGDVLWYLAICAAGIGVNLSDVAQRNAAKLQRRYPQGFDPDKSKNRV